MKRICLLSTALFAATLFAPNASNSVSADSPTLATKADASQSHSIFNGSNLDGWSGDDRLWSVRDGVIHGETTKQNPAKGNTFLIWKDGTTGDFEFQTSFRCNATNNSGIQYRSKHIEDKSAPNEWVVRGYQHEIRNEVNFPNVSGFIYGEGLPGRGRVCLVGEKAIQKDGKKQVIEQLITAGEFKELFRLDDWNDVTIVAKGNNVKHYLNGRLILDFTDSADQALTEGVLALQLHAGAPMWVEFKDLKMKSL